jgi:hypothetical protein
VLPHPPESRKLLKKQTVRGDDHKHALRSGAQQRSVKSGPLNEESDHRDKSQNSSRVVIEPPPARGPASQPVAAPISPDVAMDLTKAARGPASQPVAAPATFKRHKSSEEVDHPSDNGQSTRKCRVCSICQTAIEEGEYKTKCGECGLPFHEECWEENLGCSAYGCSNVNALKKGPDVAVNPSPSPLPFQAGNGMPAASRATTKEESLLLAASILSAVFGLRCFGFLSLVALAGVIIYLLRSGSRANLRLCAACLAVCFLGFILGLILSVFSITND